jgi:hypothetical protein
MPNNKIELESDLNGSSIGEVVGSLTEFVSMERNRSRNHFSYEKMVGAAVTAIVIGVGIWTVNTVNGLNESVVALKVQVQHQNEQLNRLVDGNVTKEARMSTMEQKLILLGPIDDRVRDIDSRLRSLEMHQKQLQ